MRTVRKPASTSSGIQQTIDLFNYIFYDHDDTTVSHIDCPDVSICDNSHDEELHHMDHSAGSNNNDAEGDPEYNADTVSHIDCPDVSICDNSHDEELHHMEHSIGSNNNDADDQDFYSMHFTPGDPEYNAGVMGLVRLIENLGSNETNLYYTGGIHVTIKKPNGEKDEYGPESIYKIIVIFSEDGSLTIKISKNMLSSSKDIFTEMLFNEWKRIIMSSDVLRKFAGLRYGTKNKKNGSKNSTKNKKNGGKNSTDDGSKEINDPQSSTDNGNDKILGYRNGYFINFLESRFRRAVEAFVLSILDNNYDAKKTIFSEQNAYTCSLCKEIYDDLDDDFNNNLNSSFGKLLCPSVSTFPNRYRNLGGIKRPKSRVHIYSGIYACKRCMFIYYCIPLGFTHVQVSQSSSESVSDFMFISLYSFYDTYEQFKISEVNNELNASVGKKSGSYISTAKRLLKTIKNTGKKLARSAVILWFARSESSDSSYDKLVGQTVSDCFVHIIYQYNNELEKLLPDIIRYYGNLHYIINIINDHDCARITEDIKGILADNRQSGRYISTHTANHIINLLSIYIWLLQYRLQWQYSGDVPPEDIASFSEFRRFCSNVSKLRNKKRLMKRILDNKHQLLGFIIRENRVEFMCSMLDLFVKNLSYAPNFFNNIMHTVDDELFFVYATAFMAVILKKSDFDSQQ